MSNLNYSHNNYNPSNSNIPNTQNVNREIKSPRILPKLILIFSLMAFVGYIFINRQYVIDQVIVWSYKPTAEVTALAEKAGIDGYGEFLYLASQPAIESAADFNSVCGTVENTASILGCYSDYRLYIYNVTDEKLAGVQEVTAAHEMLHAAYSRLKTSDKEKINALLDVEYQKIKEDPSLKERVAFYEKTEPGQLYNELHSVIGTEVGGVSAELEAYFKQYFSDRSKVITLNTKYISVFKELSDRATVLSAQLADLANSISARSTNYNNDLEMLNQDISDFNKRAASNGFTSQAQFNSQRASLESRVVSINAAREDINGDTDRYNKILEEYNSIVLASKKLYDSIDSKKLESAESV